MAFKTLNWNKLPLYKKVSLYQEHLTKSKAKYADKLIVKKILNKNYPEINIPKTVRILDNNGDIKQDDINPNHILKSTHGSSWNIDFNKISNLEIIKKKLIKWNKTYSNVEKHYSFIEPRFFIEEKIHDFQLPYQSKATIFMFRCIHGEANSVEIYFSNKRFLYDLDWNPLLNHEEQINKPDKLNEMINIANKLSSKFVFVRIDLMLSIENKIYFNEFTFSPNKGRQLFPEDVELKLGIKWN